MGAASISASEPKVTLTQALSLANKRRSRLRLPTATLSRVLPRAPRVAGGPPVLCPGRPSSEEQFWTDSFQLYSKARTRHRHGQESLHCW